MPDPRSEPRGGGILIALALLAGGGLGAALGEGSIGILAGLALGIVAALALAWWERRPR